MPLLLALIAVEIAILINIYRIHNPKFKERTKSIGVQWSTQKGDSKMADLSLNVGQSSNGKVTPFLADGTTETPGATVTSATWSISDPSVSVSTNADFTVTVSGVTATAAPIKGSVTAVITDSDGTVQTFTAEFTITVGTAPHPSRTASIGVSWSTPTP